MRDLAELRRFLRDLTMGSTERQKAAIAKLSDAEREEGDLIMAELRIEGGHGERPSGGSSWCNSCGELTNANQRVKWAWHPASFEI
jgi:hypothetical protein